jgi:hypothetical protein
MAGIKSEGILIGKWIGFDNCGTYGNIKVTKEYRGKVKTYLLKVLGASQVDNAESAWGLYKGQEMKFTYGLTEMSVYKDREYPSSPCIFGINNAGEEPKDEPRQPDKQAEPHQLDESEDELLPF